MKEKSTLEKLRDNFSQAGRVGWIGVRPQRKAPLCAMQTVLLDPVLGLGGDHYQARSGQRQVTLIGSGHLDNVAGFLGLTEVEPTVVRRNIVVAGLNLRALKGRRFRVGAAILEYTGECHPCSRMETVLGPGGYNAMRGHGGICARVVAAGQVAVGDPVQALIVT